MKVKRVVKFNIKKSHIDFQYIKAQLIEWLDFLLEVIKNEKE